MWDVCRPFRGTTPVLSRAVTAREGIRATLPCGHVHLNKRGAGEDEGKRWLAPLLRGTSPFGTASGDPEAFGGLCRVGQHDTLG
jgi:hypothetical protein